MRETIAAVTLAFSLFYALVIFLCFALVGAAAGFAAALVGRLGERPLLLAAIPVAVGWWIWAGWLELPSRGISRGGWLLYVAVSSAGIVRGAVAGGRLAARSRRHGRGT